MIIATKQVINANYDISYDMVADVKDIKSFQKNVQKIDKNKVLRVYDKGFIQGSQEKIVEVGDHINKTGINAAIKNLNIEFKDISRLYMEKSGVITTCCGKNLNEKHKNPSHYLCVFSVFLFYMGFKKIKGFIINEEVKKNI